MAPVVVVEDDPHRVDVASLMERHVVFAQEVTPAGHVHALGPESLVTPEVTVFGARRDGVLLGVGALREFEPGHGEIMSMHTLEDVRGQGVGRAIVEAVLGAAHERGYERVSLETGTSSARPVVARRSCVASRPWSWEWWASDEWVATWFVG